MPRWHPISISGYHIREAGSTAAQELAFTLKDGFTYVERALERGLSVDVVRAPALVLLQRPHRLLRGDRQVPSRAPDLGPRDARTLRRPRRALADDALPHPDGRGLADRAAAAGQHRPDDDRGAGRGARGHPVAAHQLLRRGARPADRRRGSDRASHPAGDRPRVRGHEHGRPARRLLLRRAADRRAGGGRVSSTSPASTSSAAWSRRSSRAFRSARSPTRPSATSAKSIPSSGSSSGSTTYRLEDEEETEIHRPDPAAERKQAARLAATRAGRDSAAVEAALAELRRAAAGVENLIEPLIAAARVARHRGRDGRRAPGGLRDLYRAASVLSPVFVASPGGISGSCR